jgi:hypothetical protein
VCAEAASCSKPSIDLVQVSNLENCCILKLRSRKLTYTDDVILCVATVKHVHVLKWSSSEQFIVMKRINLREPVTCMQMTPNSVLFGSDAIFELDTGNFQLDGLCLDELSLAYITG